MSTSLSCIGLFLASSRPGCVLSPVKKEEKEHKYLGWLCSTCAMQELLGRAGVALRVHMPLHPTAQKMSFWIPRMAVFNVCNARNWPWETRVALCVHLSTPQPRKCVFGCLGWLCSTCATQETVWGFRGGAPCAHTFAPHSPENEFLDT